MAWPLYVPPTMVTLAPAAEEVAVPSAALALAKVRTEAFLSIVIVLNECGFSIERRAWEERETSEKHL